MSQGLILQTDPILASRHRQVQSCVKYSRIVLAVLACGQILINFQLYTQTCIDLQSWHCQHYTLIYVTGILLAPLAMITAVLSECRATFAYAIIATIVNLILMASYYRDGCTPIHITNTSVIVCSLFLAAALLVQRKIEYNRAIGVNQANYTDQSVLIADDTPPAYGEICKTTTTPETNVTA